MESLNLNSMINQCIRKIILNKYNVLATISDSVILLYFSQFFFKNIEHIFRIYKEEKRFKFGFTFRFKFMFSY